MTPAEKNRADFPKLFQVVAEFRDAFGRVKDLHMRSTVTGESHGKPHDFAGMTAVSLSDIRLKPSAMEICERNTTHE